MKTAIQRKKRRQRRKRGIRASVFGTPVRPRMTVFRSHKHTYVQIIDDLQGRTLASASSNEKSSKVTNGGAIGGAIEIGKRIAERAKSAGVSAIVFDRNGYRYHGRVKAMADAAREGGLQF